MEAVMVTLIPLIKSDRQREIILHKSKGYTFRTGENNYIYIRNICVYIDNKRYEFQMRANQSEQKFYFYIEHSCIYLTIIEIYRMLKKISSKIGIRRVVEILQSERSEIAKIDYMGLGFDVKFFNLHIPKGKILLPESNLEINYEYLFLLIALIQDKSNYLWKLSTSANDKYVDGILRLFSCLISTKKNKVLKELGWDYNTFNKEYYINNENIMLNDKNSTININGKITKTKYYLTQIDFEDIINFRNPSNFVNDGGLVK
jgi:hypothetical protein